MSDQRFSQDDEFDFTERDSVSSRGWNPVSGGGRFGIQAPDGHPQLKVTQDGDRYLDFLPHRCGVGNPGAAPGQWHWELTFAVHKNVGPPGGGETRLCPARYLKKKCAVCDFTAEMLQRQSLPQNVRKAVDDMKKLSFQQAYNVVDVTDADSANLGVQLYTVAFHNFGKPFKKFLDAKGEDHPYHDFSNPLRGYTVGVTFVTQSGSIGEGRTFKYFGAGSFQMFERQQPYTREWLKLCMRLEDLLVLPDYDEVRTLLEESFGHLPAVQGRRGDLPPGMNATHAAPGRPLPPRGLAQQSQQPARVAVRPDQAAPQRHQPQAQPQPGRRVSPPQEPLPQVLGDVVAAGYNGGATFTNRVTRNQPPATALPPSQFATTSAAEAFPIPSMWVGPPDGDGVRLEYEATQIIADGPDAGMVVMEDESGTDLIVEWPDVVLDPGSGWERSDGRGRPIAPARQPLDPDREITPIPNAVPVPAARLQGIRDRGVTQTPPPQPVVESGSEDDEPPPPRRRRS